MSVFVVTGARGGIGLEYVRQLADSATNTIFALVRDTGADIQSLEDIKTNSPGKIFILECDVTSDSSVEQMGRAVASQLAKGDQKIDTIINNAAIQNSAGETGLSAKTENLIRHVNSNVGGPLRVAQSLLPYLKQNGTIANISSGMGSLGLLSEERITPGIASYSISKAALNMLTVHQAYELKGKAIVVCIDPGHVKTGMGGPKAVMEIRDSAKQVLNSLSGLSSSDSGRFILYNGDGLAW